MPYYEVIYETGDYSVAFYEDDAEALYAVQAHHERAIAGQPGGPTGAPAARVVKVLVYSEHPDDYDPTDDMTADEISAAAAAASEATEGDVQVVAAHVRSLSSPLAQKEAPHDSAYVAKEDKNLELPWVG